MAKVAFTGSTKTGRVLLGAARGNLKKLMRELGGKLPAAMMEDADMALAVPSVVGVARGIFGHAGQVCGAGSRVYVQRSAYGQFATAIATEAAWLRRGPDPATDLGLWSAPPKPTASPPRSPKVRRKVPRSSPAAPAAASPY